MPKTPSHHVLLGFDFGMKKIGVAVGQTITQTASPLTLLKAQDGVPHWDSIRDLIDTWKVDAFVVGIPYNMDGSEQPLTLAARRFAGKLEGRFHLPVYLIDERLTTIEARRHLFEEDVSRSKQLSVDSYAAKIILENWLKQNN